MLPNDWTQILGGFPPVDFAFTYGSGAIQQGGYNYQRKPSELPMLDLIFIVENSETWHSENLKMNPTHYTSLFPMNAQSIAFVQDKIPAHFWFNAYVPVKGGNMSGRLMKYGVISRKHAIRDLTSWNDFYIAGRLQKPVNVLQSNSTVDSAILENRLMAIKTALLLLPETFSEVDLYSTVVSLSYMGDPRMFVGENPNKVRSLAQRF